jgi:hypothetical protein
MGVFGHSINKNVSNQKVRPISDKNYLAGLGIKKLKNEDRMRIVRHILIAIVLAGFISCADDSTGPDNSDDNPGVGTVNVTGAVQAQHDGASWYAGLRSETDDFINLTLNISEQLPDEPGASSFSLSIRFVGEDEPFDLSTGEYEIGHGQGNVIVIVNYSNSVDADNTVRYGTTPNSTGTVTIQSASETRIEASYDVTIDAGQNTEGGQVNITGEIDAECLLAGVSGVGC